MEEIRKIIREEIQVMLNENFNIDVDLLVSDFKKIKEQGVFNLVKIGAGVIYIDGGQWRYYPERQEISQQNEYSKGFFQTSKDVVEELKRISGRNYAYNIKRKVEEWEEGKDEDWDDDVMLHDYEYILTPIKLKAKEEIIKEMGEEDPIKLAQDMIKSNEEQVKSLEDELKYREADMRVSNLPKDEKDARVATMKLTKDRLEQAKQELELSKQSQINAVKFSQMQTDAATQQQSSSQIEPQT